MITVSDVSLKFGEKPLFKDVNLKFTPGNCYGIIGANGAGKSTFLKVLNGEIEHDSGEISISTGERMATLVQNHFAFDDYSVMETVKMGFPKLYELEKAKDAIYEKPDFSEEDGIKASEMEAEFGEPTVKRTVYEPFFGWEYLYQDMPRPYYSYTDLRSYWPEGELGIPYYERERMEI